MSLRLLFTSKPHGEQKLYLLEDHKEHPQRIYELHDSRGHAVPLLGSEMQSLIDWWAEECRRQPAKAVL